jgi:adenosylmethionine-8-amino-7-oxononanoate aminotransferase
VIQELENLSIPDKLAIVELLFGYYRGHAERSVSKAAQKALEHLEIDTLLSQMSKADLIDLAAKLVVDVNDRVERP